MLVGPYAFLDKIKHAAEQAPYDELSIRFKHDNDDFKKIYLMPEYFILYRAAYGIDLDDYSDFTSCIKESDEDFKIFVDYYHFLTMQKPFIAHIKKILPSVADNRWNSCIMTLDDILVWEIKPDKNISYAVFSHSVGLLATFFRAASICPSRCSPSGLVALLEMDKALVNAYSLAKNYYLKNNGRLILGERSRDDLLSIEFRKDLIDLIEKWQYFVTTFRVSLMRAANVDTENTAYRIAAANFLPYINVRPVELISGAVETLYCDSEKSFIPLRKTEIVFSNFSLLPAYSLSKQMKQMSLRPPFQRSTTHPNFGKNFSTLLDQKANSTKITLVFDIDHVIADYNSIDNKTILFFLRKGAIITAASKTHYIFPGIVELFKKIFTYKNVSVSFFSGGKEERNIEFVEKFLSLCIGEEKYQAVKDSIGIFSSQHLLQNTFFNQTQLEKKYGIYSGNNIKDIAKVLSEKDCLENAILIDDDSSYLKFGQQSNFLFSYRASAQSIQHLTLKYYENDPARLKDFFSSANNAFYLASMLMTIIETMNSKKEQGPLSAAEILFSLQFEPIDAESLRYKRKKLWSDMSVYEDGLSILKTINPALEFCTKKTYLQTISDPATDQENNSITLAQEKEAKCLVM